MNNWAGNKTNKASASQQDTEHTRGVQSDKHQNEERQERFNPTIKASRDINNWAGNKATMTSASQQKTEYTKRVQSNKHQNEERQKRPSRKQGGAGGVWGLHGAVSEG